MNDQVLRDERKLLKSLGEGNFEAFDLLFRFYNKRLYCFAKSILKNREDARDIVQEVFLRVWKNREQIKQETSFRSFLFTISYHIIVDHLRKRMSEIKFREYLVQHAITMDSTVEAGMEFEELKRSYQNAINELPLQKREVFQLHRNEHLSYVEIAEKLDISVNTVKNHMTKAISFIRKKVGSRTLMGVLFVSLFV